MTQRSIGSTSLPSPQVFTVSELAAEAEREVRLREGVYRRLVAEGRLREDTAERRIALMRCIAERLRREEADVVGKCRLL